MRNQLILITWLCAWAASATAVPMTSKTIIGDWYGEGQPYDSDVYWIDHFGSDGSFAGEARFCNRGTGRYHVEAGTWSYQNGKLRISIEYVNGRDDGRTDQYDLIAFDGHTWKDRLISSSTSPEAAGAVFTEIRAPRGFRLPDCHQTS